MSWPHLRDMRWTPEQVQSYYASGIWTPRGLDALIAEQARARPDGLAFADESTELTWPALNARIRAVAAGLVEAGVAPGAVVGVRMANSVDHAVIIFAIATAGAVAFELPPDANPGQVALALARTRAVALFADADPTPAEHQALSPPALVARGSAAITGSGPGSAGELPGQHPDDVAILLGTSGTTGTPKIVMRTANATLAMARNVVSRTGVGADDVVLVGAPLSGGIGYINGLCTAADTGATMLVPHGNDPATLLSFIERYRATALQTVPTILRRIAQAPAAESADLSSLRLVQSGGAYLHAHTATLVESRFDCHVISAYGAVDLGTPSMVDAHRDTAEHRHETVGPLFAESEVALLDASGAPVTDGETGEVVMRGPNTALGYFEDPEATRALFDEQGWGHFGDLGRIDADGYLRIVGRLKEIINRGGKKLSIDEIEGHVRGFPGLRDVAAVGYADPDLGERCAVVVVTEPWLTLTVAKLRVYLGQRRVPKALWPERVETIDELPLSPQGKVRRRELREMLKGQTAC
jgi:acyl-CoA synthetase (AMP-forming)/AMP-acid ligase II